MRLACNALLSAALLEAYMCVKKDHGKSSGHDFNFFPLSFSRWLSCSNEIRQTAERGRSDSLLGISHESCSALIPMIPVVHVERGVTF